MCDIRELILRRRRQLLVHSVIYYRFNENLISDQTWSNWAVELEKLQKEYGLYIVSNCQIGYIEAFLHYYGLEQYFKDTLCYGENKLQKGDNIALMAKRNKLDAAVYVGDIQADYEASCHAGTAFIHAAYGFGKINDIVPEMERFSDLPDILDKVDGFR